MKLILSCVLLFSFNFHSYSQNDTINQVDDQGRKQGHWIYYGKDRPQSGYPLEGKIEEGPYKDDRKEGLWIKYHKDGITPKLKGQYHNNRPSGSYTKIGSGGEILDTGTFYRSNFNERIERVGGNWEHGSSHRRDISNLKTRQFKLRPTDSTTTKGFAIGYIDEYIMRNDSLVLNNTYKAWAKGVPLNLNGYNKLYNTNAEIFIDGEFKSGVALNVKIYVYDSDGILNYIEVFQGGKYIRDGIL